MGVSIGRGVEEVKRIDNFNLTTKRTGTFESLNPIVSNTCKTRVQTFHSS